MTATDPALEEFCRAQWPRLVRSLTAYTGDPQQAEDLAGEVVVRIVRDWRRVQRMDAPGPWVHRVAMNLAHGRYRRLGALRRARARGGEAHPATHLDGDAVDAVAVREALALLPPRQRQVVALRYVAGLTLAETAQVMGISEGGVKSQAHAGLARLRQLLDDDGWTDEALAADGPSVEEDADVR